MEIEVARGEALEYQCDVLVLKHAQAVYGVDELVVQRLEANGVVVTPLLPKPNGFRLIASGGVLAAKRVLFVGVKTLREFDYEGIRQFACCALAALAGAYPEARLIGITLHGPGYGLDEVEAFRAEVAGLYDAVASGDIPEKLERVTFIERNSGRAQRLSQYLTTLGFRSDTGASNRFDPPIGGTGAVKELQSAGIESGQKSHIFVAMPFDGVFDDRFHYGIQRAVNATGCLCERADLSAFTGDVLVWVKGRIATAALVVADLTTANPNVYLEVGYAWGCGVPTVLIAEKASDLRFDVRTQKCLLYEGSIRRLEELLTGELAILRP